MNDQDINDAVRGDPTFCPWCPHALSGHFEGTGKCAVMKCPCPGRPNQNFIMSTEPINPEDTPPDTPTPPPAQCDITVWRHVEHRSVRCELHKDHTQPHEFPVTYQVTPLFTGPGDEATRAEFAFMLPNNPGSVLQEADTIINGERQKDYGSPLQSFTTIAALWSPILGIDVDANQVALCMIQLKVARAKNGGMQRDSLVDIAGYAGCIELMEREREGQ